MDLSLLAAEFPRESVHWRVQGSPFERNGKFSAMALAYIDARDVMDRLDDVCGAENWQSRYTETPRGRILCEIGIHTDKGWVWKSDGAGDTAVEKEKGGISDSLKRAAVQWGIGRYLYRLDSPWVQCEVRSKDGKNYWKAWAEDPWSKVKVTSYHAAQASQSSAPSALDLAIANAQRAKTEDELRSIWGSHDTLQDEPAFRDAINKRRKAIQPQGKAA